MEAQCKCPKCGRDWILDVPAGEDREKLWEGIDPAITAGIPDWSTAKEWQKYKFPHSDLDKPAPAVCCECWSAVPPRYVPIETETSGKGLVALPGDTVTIRFLLFLNRGDLIQSQSATFTIGQRRVIAGLEYGVEGMRVGGRRRFRVGPHLAYGEAGVVGLVPPNAVLIFDVELLDVRPAIHLPS